MKFIARALIIVSALLVLTAPAALASDSALFGACKQAPNSAVCRDKGTTTDPVIHIVRVAADIIATLTGIGAIVFIILGAFTMVTSGGNSESVANARKRITYAVIGLVIVVLAWTIITFVTSKLITT